MARKNTLAEKVLLEAMGVAKALPGIAMELRRVPLRQLFLDIRHVARMTTLALNKKSEFFVSGEDIEVDPTLVELLADPLVHLVRNAIDHGLESPAEREVFGKTPLGIIQLSAFQDQGQLTIEIRDDGKGLDADFLTWKAVEKGILPPGSRLTVPESHLLIFTPGFSTRSEITEISGRGIGMDVVKTNVTLLKGDIELETEVGKGTCFRIRLPLVISR